MSITEQNKLSPRPDIAKESTAAKSGTLDKVGMEAIEQPVLVRSADGKLNQVPALIDLFVSLDDPHAKGIHMSRLYAAAKTHLSNTELSMETMMDLIAALLKSHESLSYSASAKVSFDYVLERPSLKSGQKGFRFYPVTLRVERDGHNLMLETAVQISYSSTCPCSAALARQLLQEKFREAFSGKVTNLSAEELVSEAATWISREENQVATPHGQRSYADMRVRFKTIGDVIHFSELIDKLEEAVKTPVQALVKREDEQEFARLNGENLMFSEDAARKFKSVLEQDSRVMDYHIHVKHIESLHPHDAVVIATKGVPGGYKA